MSVSYSAPSRAAQRVSWFLLFLIGVALTVTLYFVKTHSQSAKKDVRELTQSIAEHEAAIRVLRAELAYFNNPVRLSDLNDEYLSVKDIEVLFPLLEVEAE